MNPQKLDFRFTHFPRIRVNNPINQRISNARKVPSEHQLRPPAGGVSNQAMPLSVILKTVAPTRVALGLGSM